MAREQRTCLMGGGWDQHGGDAAGERGGLAAAGPAPAASCRSPLGARCSGLLGRRTGTSKPQCSIYSPTTGSLLLRSPHLTVNGIAVHPVVQTKNLE